MFTPFIPAWLPRNWDDICRPGSSVSWDYFSAFSKLPSRVSFSVDDGRQILKEETKKTPLHFTLIFRSANDDPLRRQRGSRQRDRLVLFRLPSSGTDDSAGEGCPTGWEIVAVEWKIGKRTCVKDFCFQACRVKRAARPAHFSECYLEDILQLISAHLRARKNTTPWNKCCGATERDLCLLF